MKCPITIYMNKTYFSFMTKLKDSQIFILRDPDNTFLKVKSVRSYQDILNRKYSMDNYFRG